MTRLWSSARRHAFQILVVFGMVVGAVQAAAAGGADDAELASRARRARDRRRPRAVARLPPARVRGRRGHVAAGRGGVVRRRAAGRLHVSSVYLAGMAAAFLLGNLARPARARLGLADRRSAARRSHAQRPGPRAGDVVVLPALFAIAWVAGHAHRNRDDPGRGRRGARRARRARAGVGRARRGRRGARADRARAARHRRPRRQRDGAADRRRPAPAARRARRGRRGARARRADRAHGARRDAPPARRDAPATTRRPSLRPQPGLDRLDALLDEVATPAWPSTCTSTASRSRCRERSTCPPTASCRRA